MADSILPGVVNGRPSRSSEFVLDAVTGQWLTGDCGPESLTTAECAVRRQVVTPALISGTVHRMLTWGGCSANGITWETQWPDGLWHSTLETQAIKDGFTVVASKPDGDTSDWLTWLRTWANGRTAVVVGLNNGQALHDAVSGLGENATNLQGHVIMLAGRHTADAAYPWDGWWTADGDSFAAGDVLQLYSEQVLMAAQPSAAFALAGGNYSMVTPVWDQNAGTLSFPAHDGIPAIELVHGQAWYAHAGARVGVYPLHAEVYEGDNSVVVWSDGRRSVSVKAQNWQIHLEDAGPMLGHVWAALDIANAAPKPAPVDIAVVTEAAAFRAIKAALAVA